MSRRRSVMSESFKYELAKDLGFYDVVQREGWAGIRTKDAGNMVKRAIQIAEEHLAKQYVGASNNVHAGPLNYRQTTASPPLNYGQAPTPSYNTYQQQAGAMNQSYQQSGQGTQRPYYS
ncbi:small acid-soluble spore protein F (minor alpha/beta-type SASP) [Paenibacillus qinlingensis]|uniref:Small acid-soluble spore protein F (Minor alpha/beta-type SASP) n=1 Tax=Paenibacillus qinlingensis TaxID=1837343 RepID=A0ABU1P7Y0_9BACL|nr:small acid-soluble spore protein F (minor alpha/beta-type SASP) [Paenibacillus qinlingensis]